MKRQNKSFIFAAAISLCLCSCEGLYGCSGEGIRRGDDHIGKLKAIRQLNYLVLNNKCI